MNSLIPSDIKLPAHIAARMGKPSALAQAVAGGLSSGGFPRISIKGSRFRIVDGDTETVLKVTELPVIIVGANPHLSKTYYKKQWTPDDEPEAPDCQSLNGISPTADSPDKQSDLCATCPQNAWGSKINPTNGKKVKACADQKRLAVVAAEDPSGPIYLVQVTPAALKGLNQYQKELSVRGIPNEVVITNVSFDTDASFPLLQFSFGGFISEEDQATVDTLFDSREVLEITGEADVGVQKIEVKAPAPKLAAPKKAAPAPVVEEVEEEEIELAPPPAPARGFGKKAAAEKPAVVAASTSGEGLADDIAALLGAIGADDA